MSQPKTIFSNRLLNPQKRDTLSTPFCHSSYDEVLAHIASKIKSTTSKRVGFYLSGQMLNEDYVVLFNRIKKAQKNRLKVIVIDSQVTMSAKVADLHLPLRAGTDIDLLNLLAIRLIKNEQIDHKFIANHANNSENYKESLLKLDEKKLLKSCGVNALLFEQFYQLFISSPNIITGWTMGVNQSIQGVDKNLAINNLHIITGQPGEIEAEALISDIPRGVVFVPIYHRKLNYLTDDKLDPLSKKPNYNHGAIWMKKV